MDQIDRFLLNLPELRHLHLVMKGDDDLLDGHQWQTLISGFSTFNFKFILGSALTPNSLQCFQTPFWLEEKHWYVAFQSNSLFSIPYFAPTHLEIPLRSPIHHTAPDTTYFLQHLSEIRIANICSYKLTHLAHIKILDISRSLFLHNLVTVVDLTQIEHLVLRSIADIPRYIPLEFSMPCLSSLTVRNVLKNDDIERIRHHRFEQIRTLNVSLSGDMHLIEQLFRLFPNIEYLKITIVGQNSTYVSVPIMDGFPCLVNVSFYVDGSHRSVEPNG